MIQVSGTPFFFSGKAHIFHLADEVLAYTASKRKKSLTDGNGKKQPQLVLASMFIYIWVFPKNRGTPKWIVYNGKPY